MIEEAIKELSKSIKSALDIIEDAFREIRKQAEEGPGNQVTSDESKRQED